MASREWFVIKTKPTKEELARINYQNQGYKTYLPVIKKKISHSGKKQIVLRPFFPGYLFLNLEPNEYNWASISATRGAIGPLRFGGQYIPVPEWVIEDIKRQEDSSGTISTCNIIKKQLKAGSPIKVDFNNQGRVSGTVFSFDGDHNVIILLDILKRRVKTSVPLKRLIL